MFRLLLLLTLALLLPTPAAVVPRQRALRVGTGGDYATLAEAIAAAPPGASLEVLAGVQSGQWTISRPLALIGQPGAVLDGGGQGTLLMIAAADVTVSGLTIRNSGRSLLNDDAAIKITASGARIIGNTIEDIHHAIYVLDGAAHTLISGNQIRGRAELMQEDRGNAIHLWNAPDTVVEQNRVVGVRDGVYVGFAPRSTFRANIFSQLRYGIHFMYADDNVFEDNTFEHSEAGAALMYSRHITLRHNVFAFSRSSRAYGLLLQECDNVRVENNLLLDISRALFVNVTRDSQFTGNLFAANDLAVQIYAASTGNSFSGNDFTGNMRLLELDRAGNNTWDGNYWEEYHGLDMDADGFGDAPFSTGDPLGSLTTDHPQLKLFRYSPAAEALEAGERAFPVLDLPAIVDAHPAMRPVAQARGQLPPLPEQPRGTVALVLVALGYGLVALAIVLGARTKRNQWSADPEAARPRSEQAGRTEFDGGPQ